ncbi:MAG: hypothetical protein CMC18_03230 [Flavobacteriaceae bacterium]|nr:hypothetical protein [Flavobacteriaceae bacterium]
MELFSVKGLPQLLKASGRFDSMSRRDYAFNYYDKCNWVITTIALRNFAFSRSLDYFVDIHSKTLGNYLGRGYYRGVLDTLIALDIIEENSNYSSNRFSKSYRLKKTAQDLGFVRVSVKSNRFLKVLQKYLELEYAEVTKNPLLSKLLYNTAQLFLLDEPYYYLERIIPPTELVEVNGYMTYEGDSTNESQLLRYEDYYTAFRALNSCSSPKDVFSSPICFKPTISPYGRVYHTGASIPRLIRKCMRTKKNEIIYEVDMSSSQITILVLEWLRILKMNNVSPDKELKREIKLSLQLLSQGGFYAYIQKNSAYCKGLEYDKLKHQILKTINAKYVPSALNKDLENIFPHFMGFINNTKQVKGHKKVSHIHLKAESNIFVEVYMSLAKEYFAILIHDCILLTEDHVHTAKDLLIQKTMELYGDVLPKNFNLDGVFKVKRVSLIDEETESYKWNKFCEETQDDLSDLYNS